MKKSDKILMTFVIFIFFSSFILIVLSRFYYNKEVEIIKANKIITRNFNFADFSGLKVLNSWEIKIEHGDTYRVDIEAPENYLKYISIGKEGETLTICTNEIRKLDQTLLKAIISLPTLTTLISNGSSQIEFVNFTIDNLLIVSSSSCKISGLNNTIHNLQINCSDSSSLDLKDNLITNADIKTSGLCRVEVKMIGGNLTCYATGGANIIYYGDIENLYIKTEGIAKIIKKKL